jgi:hypothetical protein
MTEAGSAQSSSEMAALPGIARILRAGSHHQLYRSLRPAGLRLRGSLTVSAILRSSPHYLIESLELYQYRPSRQRNPEISLFTITNASPCLGPRKLNVYQCQPTVPVLRGTQLLSLFWIRAQCTREILNVYQCHPFGSLSRKNSAFITVLHPPNCVAFKAILLPVNNLLGGSGTDGNHSARH